MPNDHQDHAAPQMVASGPRRARKGQGTPTAATDGPTMDRATVRAWLDRQLARQGITASTDQQPRHVAEAGNPVLCRCFT
jgi:hypothetical protein